MLPFSRWPDRARLSEQLPLVQRLLATLDFVGFSMYPTVAAGSNNSEDVTMRARRAIDRVSTDVDEELRAMGLDAGGRARVWAEVGVGGGVSRCGDVRASDGDEALRWTYLGVKFPYEPKYALSAAAAAAMSSYYRALLNALAGGDGAPAAAFLWNLVSWDVQGVSGGSSGYEMADVVEAIRSHNARS